MKYQRNYQQLKRWQSWGWKVFIPLAGMTIGFPFQSVLANPTSPSPIVSPSPTATPAEGKFAPTQVQIVAPVEGTVLDIPAATVVVRAGVGATVVLKVNDRLVDASSIGRTETDAAKGTVTTTWYGVALNPGSNVLSVQATNNGVIGTVATTRLSVRGLATRVEVRALESQVPADGRSLLNLEGRFLDADGNVSRQDTLVTLTASAGEFAGVDADTDAPGFQAIVRGGKFTAQLRSPGTPQTVRIRAASLGMEGYAQALFETNLRTSVATGVLDLRLGTPGTDYYRNFREFLAPNDSTAPELTLRGQGFATGRWQDWAVTGAYNSSRPLNRSCNGNDRLFRDTSQNCEDLYPVYGDTSRTEVLTPSRSSVFFKLERSIGVANSIPDLFQWGDYNTPEFSTRSQQFSATSRNLHGAKVNYNFGNLQVSGFYGDNVQGFQRDTIAPDGTSGYYFLSRRALLGGSEQIYVETAPLNDTGTLLDRVQLTRGIDYEIDYDRGSVLLRRPLLRTDVASDGRLVARHLVATYQYVIPSSSNNIYGGRVQFNLARTTDRETWLGSTFIRENQGVRSFDLYGIDALVGLGTGNNIIGEYARSSNNVGIGSSVDASAYRIEGSFRFGESLTSRAFYRSMEAGFSNNATVSFIPGQTRYGVDTTAKVSDSTNVRLSVEREENRGTPPLVSTNLLDLLLPRTNPLSATLPNNNSVTTVTAGVQQKFGNLALDLDYVTRSRLDEVTPANSGDSSQIRTRAAYPLAHNLTLRGVSEFNLGSTADALNPARGGIGLEWAVYPGVALQLNHNIIGSSAQYQETSFTSLDLNANYKLSSTTSLLGRYSLSPYQSIGSVGIQQGIVLSPGFKLDLTYDRAIGSNTVQTGAATQFAQPIAIGSGSSALGVTGGDSYSVAVNYTDIPGVQATARYEVRNTTTGSTIGLNAGVTGKVNNSLTTFLRYQQNSYANQVINSASGLGETVNFRLGLAYRDPQDDRFNGLLSYQYRRNPSVIPDYILTGNLGTGSEDHTFAAEGIYAPDWQWEFYGKYAFRQATTYLNTQTTATGSTNLAQLRATYRLGYEWDLVGDWRGIYQGGGMEMGLALETGYHLTPNLRLAAGYGFGRVDDPTSANSRSNSGAYIGLTWKLDDIFGFGLQNVRPRDRGTVNANPPVVPANTPPNLRNVNPAGGARSED